MKTQLKTIREALEFIDGLKTGGLIQGRTREALTALSELERMAGEPVAWQRRMRPTWGSDTAYPWSPWEQCTKGQANDHWKTPLLHEWAYEARALYTTAPPAQQPHDYTRSHPHENMDGYCVLRTEIARLTNENARLQAHQPQYEAGDMASAHNDGFRAGVASVTQQPQAETAQATMAGLDASVNILSSLVDEQRQLLAEVDAVFGVDAHGIVLEDGDSALIDRVRAHLAATSEAKQPQAEAVPSNCRERLRSEGKPYPRSTCAVCGNLSPNWKKCNASIAAMKQGNQP